MKKLLVISGLIFIAFLIEYFVFNFLHPWLMPNLVLLVVIFVNLSLGIRYSIFAAVLGGFLNDSFSIGGFGVNILSLVICAYATTFVGKYVYHRGSNVSRLIMVFLICTLNLVMMTIFNINVFELGQVFKYIYLPEIISTLLVSVYTFRLLKKCVLKLFVSSSL